MLARPTPYFKPVILNVRTTLSTVIYKLKYFTWLIIQQVLTYMGGLLHAVYYRIRLRDVHKRAFLRESNPRELPLSVRRVRRFSRNLVSTIQPGTYINPIPERSEGIW